MIELIKSFLYRIRILTPPHLKKVTNIGAKKKGFINIPDRYKLNLYPKDSWTHLTKRMDKYKKKVDTYISPEKESKNK